jgi:hypothetical protein
MYTYIHIAYVHIDSLNKRFYQNIVEGVALRGRPNVLYLRT